MERFLVISHQHTEQIVTCCKASAIEKFMVRYPKDTNVSASIIGGIAERFNNRRAKVGGVPMK